MPHRMDKVKVVLNGHILQPKAGKPSGASKHMVPISLPQMRLALGLASQPDLQLTTIAAVRTVWA